VLQYLSIIEISPKFCLSCDDSWAQIPIKIHDPRILFWQRSFWFI